MSEEVLGSGSVINNWEILYKVDGKSYFCKCIHCGVERKVFNNQLRDTRINPIKARCRNCTKLKVGDEYVTNKGFKYKIEEYVSSTKVLIKFEPDDLCPDGYERYTTKYYINDGCIDYPFERSAAGIGYIGYLKKDFTANRSILDTWIKMIKRCYGPSEKDKAYTDCSVCEDWHNFYNFHRWYDKQKVNGFYQKGYQIDKDILHPDVKVYSPEHCRLVPEEINSFTNNVHCDSRKSNLPTGVSWKKRNNKYQVSIKSGYNTNKYLCLVSCPKEGYEIYKKEKLKSARKLADKWEGLVVPEIISALRNYKSPEWDWVANEYIKEVF